MLETGIKYALKTKTPLSLNWVLLKGINNSDEEAIYLGENLNPDICRLNVTTYVGDKFQKASIIEKDKFIKTIKKASKGKHNKCLEVNSFETTGNDINAGCGQLIGKWGLKNG